MSRSFRLLSRGAALLLCMSVIPPFAKASPSSTDQKWSIVYIGSSWLPEATRLFGEDIKSDLGVDVSLRQLNVERLAVAADKLRQGKWEWAAVKNADVIVVSVTEHHGSPGFCTDTTSDTPYAMTPEQYRTKIDGFLSALIRRASPKTTIIRITTQAVLPHFRELWRERGVEKQCLAGWMELNAQWKEAAASFGVPVVDVLAAWNGKDGARDAPRAYFGDDGGHLSEAGSRAAAELLRSDGYAPLAR
jgi:hypothetical protein